MFKIPNEYSFRLHHIRPRFKNNLEAVLHFVATSINELPETDRESFRDSLQSLIRRFPGNVIRNEKTISNWRTEISALFGLVEYDFEGEVCRPSRIAQNFAVEQDLPKFFKLFLAGFQYPGGHLKGREILSATQKGIKFKPAHYVIRLLQQTATKNPNQAWVTASEVTHCVFNDLRVTRDQRSASETADVILLNRENNDEYDSTSDVIRYARDVLDYMVYARLMVCNGNRYYLNALEGNSIASFLSIDKYFSGYDFLKEQVGASEKEAEKLNPEWFEFVNDFVDDAIPGTDIGNVLQEFNEKSTFGKHGPSSITPGGGELSGLTTKEIGDFGENLALQHEYARLSEIGLGPQLHLVKMIPTPLAVGFDIQSLESDESKRYIEVKTTFSTKAITASSFHMTTNEWIVAEGHGDRYFVYRIQVSQEEGNKLFLIQNPVQKYKENKLKMVPRDGADVRYDDESGVTEELLQWRN